MRLGVEIIAKAPIPLHLGHFFESWLADPTGALRRSLGRDEYHLGIRVQPGHRLAATGRTFICQIDALAAELGPNQARPCVPVRVPPDAGSNLALGLRTNVFLNVSELEGNVQLRLVSPPTPPRLLALPAAVTVHEVAPGRYVVVLPGPEGGISLQADT